MSSAREAIIRENLIKIAESFLCENEVGMARLLFSLDIKIRC